MRILQFSFFKAQHRFEFHNVPTYTRFSFLMKEVTSFPLFSLKNLGAVLDYFRYRGQPLKKICLLLMSLYRTKLAHFIFYSVVCSDGCPRALGNTDFCNLSHLNELIETRVSECAKIYPGRTLGTAHPYNGP